MSTTRQQCGNGVRSCLCTTMALEPSVRLKTRNALRQRARSENCDCWERIACSVFCKPCLPSYFGRSSSADLASQMKSKGGGKRERTGRKSR